MSVAHISNPKIEANGSMIRIEDCFKLFALCTILFLSRSRWPPRTNRALNISFPFSLRLIVRTKREGTIFGFGPISSRPSLKVPLLIKPSSSFLFASSNWPVLGSSGNITSVKNGLVIAALPCNSDIGGIDYCGVACCSGFWCSNSNGLGVFVVEESCDEIDGNFSGLTCTKLKDRGPVQSPTSTIIFFPTADINLCGPVQFRIGFSR